MQHLPVRPRLVLTLMISLLTLISGHTLTDTTSSVSSVSMAPPHMMMAAFLNQSYSFRKEVTIQSSQVSGSGSLTDFPILISVTDNDLRTIANGGSVQSTSGFDIIFTDSDGTTILDHEIESYDATTGAYIAWVRVPTLSATVNTDIYVYYGNSTISTDPSTGSTWDADYAAVYHFPTDNNFEDGTSNNNDGTNNGLFSYSEFSSVQVEADNGSFDFSILPNPNNGSFKVALSGVRGDRVRLSLVNLQGQSIYESQEALSTKTKRAEIQIELNHSPSPGIYLLHIEHAGKRIVKRVIIQ